MRILLLLAALAGSSAVHADGLTPMKAPVKDFLPVDEAFQLQPAEWKDGKLVVGWIIARDYYLYRKRFKFMVAEPTGAKLGAPVLPAGELHEDEFFGKTEVYRGDVQAELPLEAPSGTVRLTVVYQGCADAGLCYPPQTRTVEARR